MNDEQQRVLDRLDDVVAEVRRQGRAAVAAQAAAESCLEAVEALQGHQAAVPATVAVPAEPPIIVRQPPWLSTLLPVLDAVDRLAASARAMTEQRQQPRGFWPFGRKAGKDAELNTLSEGLRVLQAQFGAAMHELGVTRISPEREAFDAEVHRAVEQRRGPAGRVLEVVRPGYRHEGRLVREADVVVGVERI